VVLPRPGGMPTGKRISRIARTAKIAKIAKPLTIPANLAILAIVI